MNLFVDISSGSLVQGIGINAPAGPITIKSQDTLDVNIYLLLNGEVQDEGESPVLKWGLVAASDLTTLLVMESTFTRQVNPLLGVFYQALAVFNTTQMVSALAAEGAPSPLPCILEIRFQLADGEILHTLDQSILVDRTILLESGTTSPVGIESYPDASTLLVTGMKDQHSGVAALDANGFLKSTDFDPAVVELITTRDQPLGHPSLDGNAQVPIAEIPIDGVSIVNIGGKAVAVGPATGAVTATTFDFTVWSSGNGTIYAPTGVLVAGAFYIIGGGAGVYQFLSAGSPDWGIWFNTRSVGNALTGTIAAGATITLCAAPGGNMVLSDFETSVGVSLIHAVTGILNRLVAGTGVVFDTTTTPGAIIINVTAGGGAMALIDAESSVGVSLISDAAGILKRIAAGNGIGLDITTTTGAIIVKNTVRGIVGLVTTAFTVPTPGNDQFVAVDDAVGFPSGGLVTIKVSGSTTTYGVFYIDGLGSGGFSIANNAQVGSTNAGGDTIPVGAEIILVDFHPINQPHANLGGFLEAPTDKSYTLILNASGLLTLGNFTIKTGSGTCTAQLKHNGTLVGTALSVTSTVQTVSLFEFLAATDLLELVISGAASPVDLAYNIETWAGFQF